MYVILPHNNIINYLIQIDVIDKNHKLHLICFASNDFEKTKKLLYYLNNNLNDEEIITALTLVDVENPLGFYCHKTKRNLFHMKTISIDELAKSEFFGINYNDLSIMEKQTKGKINKESAIISLILDSIKESIFTPILDFLALEGLINVGKSTHKELQDYHRKYFNETSISEIIAYMDDPNIV